MLDLNLFNKVLEILENALASKITLIEALFVSGYNNEWWEDIQVKIEVAHLKNRITDQELIRYKTLVNRLMNMPKPKVLNSAINKDKVTPLVNQILDLIQYTKNDPDKKCAAKIGELLLVLKNTLPDGTYIQFIESTFPFSQRTARNYTKLFFDLGGTYNANYEPLENEINTYDPLEESNSLYGMVEEAIVKNINDDYDSRSKWWVDRDEDGKITRYHYNILVSYILQFQKY